MAPSPRMGGRKEGRKRKKTWFRLCKRKRSTKEAQGEGGYLGVGRSPHPIGKEKKQGSEQASRNKGRERKGKGKGFVIIKEGTDLAFFIPSCVQDLGEKKEKIKNPPLGPRVPCYF